MAQTTVLAAGMTAATSLDIVVASGTSVAVGLFAAAAISPNIVCEVRIDTPDADTTVAMLSGADPIKVLSGPGTFRVVRPVTKQAVGVFTES